VLAALHRSAFAPLGQQSWTAEAIAGLAAGPGVVIRVADRLPGGPAAGFIMARHAPGSSEILTLCVAPGARRTGLGHALIRSIMASLDGEDGSLFLEVAADNIGAITFYRSLGFAKTGIRADYYSKAGRSIDALIYSRPLTARENPGLFLCQR
jgi:ribosomal-protein-alanine N-acetyltransferase